MKRLVTGVYCEAILEAEECDHLIRICNYTNNWAVGERISRLGLSVCDDLPGEDIFIDSIPALNKIYTDRIQPAAEQAIKAIMKTSVQIIGERPLISRFSADKIPGLQLHKDNSDITLVLALNDAFAGGGTYFPHVKTTIKQGKGSALFFAGSILHRSFPVLSGIRYVLVNFFQAKSCAMQDMESRD